ncbi:hypothetical protein BJ508DRAFT_15977 [Ascobolus immersus RN42]|uniref:Protein kinase domain-containing protein n=1 Tax=Ascobolus immersus RN42 TaxID=1160509 RepID=A0A3N4HPT4_ASCIM|nr:hypothetical protein BJ508DRAFT_15977 [Ascobolus immersus RN42]
MLNQSLTHASSYLPHYTVHVAYPIFPFNPTGDTPRVQISDFSTSVLPSSSDNPTTQMTKFACKKPRYSAPEQILDIARPSIASNIFSLGLLISRLLTSRTIEMGSTRFFPVYRRDGRVDTEDRPAEKLSY